MADPAVPAQPRPRETGRSSPDLRSVARLVVFALAVVGGLLGVVLFVDHLRTDPLADVRAYYDAGARLNAGLPLYPPGADTDAASFYRYPPLLAILFRPIAALLPYEPAAVLWGLFGVACFIATLWWLGIRKASTWAAVGLLGVPIGWALAVGQAQVQVTLLAALGTPWTVALAANLKVLPALMAIYWVGRRDWQALGRFALAMAVLFAIQVVLEPRGMLDFLTMTNLSQVGEVRNLSPYAISPWLWVAFVVVLGLAALRLAPGRWGWAAAVTFSILASPRLLTYMLMTLLACLREPAKIWEPRRRRIG